MAYLSTYYFVVLLLLISGIYSAKILALFPYNGRSHHIYFSTFVEELASRKHSVVVVNYFPVKNYTTLRQISLEEGGITKDTVKIEDSGSLPGIFKDLFFAYDTAEAFKHMANDNCRRLVGNGNIKEMIDSEERFDVIIVEQFVTDCGFAIASRFKAPTVGMTAHVLFPWTYSRLGADNHPAFVPNHFTGGSATPDLWGRIKSGVFNLFFNVYYREVIQRSDNEIVQNAFPGTPNLETLANNISLIMLNQYFPLTESRVYGANVVEIGGMHVKHQGIYDKNLQAFLDSAKNGIIYISFGSVASDLPKRKIDEILKVIENSELRFLWKIDNTADYTIPSNLMTSKWLPQVDILCHENVRGFISHSGMLSSSEAMHCGVPVVSVPLFGDQFANAASARVVGLGVTVNLEDLNENTLEAALQTILRESFQKRAKHLSLLWNDRPVSAMDTAVYWVEYVAKYGAVPQLRPASIGVPLYQYLLIDVWLTLLGFLLIVCYLLTKFISLSVTYVKKKHCSKSRIGKSE